MEAHFAPPNGSSGILTMTDASVSSLVFEVESPRVIEFDDFYREHHASVARALAMTLGDSELAADATNEAMTRAIQRWDAVSTYANPSGWVYRVGLNWARSWLRRRKRERDRPVSFGPSETTFEIVDDELSGALQSLSMDHRTVVICRLYLDWSVEQTADSLRVPVGTVKSRLARALEQLRTELERGAELEGDSR